MFSDRDIKEAIRDGKIIINPYEEKNVGPASLDLRLGNDFKRIKNDYDKTKISLSEEQHYEIIKGDKIIIQAGEFVLGTTLEYIGLANGLAAQVEGRSSIGRLGLFVQNAGWIDPGFEGNITLELFNANRLPLELDAGRRICQLVFARTESLSDKPYAGKYKGQKLTTGSRAHLDYEVSKK